MSEPRTAASSVEELEDVDVVYWHIADDRIGGFVSTAYGLRTDEGLVMVDPLPLEAPALERLGEIRAIVITSGSHQRSAWRYRSELGAPVWAPALAQEIDEEPDERYGHADVLPGDLVALFTPGAGTTQHTLILDDYVAFVPDLVVRPPDGELSLTPDEYMHEPGRARESVRLLAEQGIEILCPAHGIPLVDGVHDALIAALERGGEYDDPDYVEAPEEDADETEEPA
jgi:hypothetical protein